PRRIYVSGQSNGGAMTQRLACELSDRFAAFASSAGLLVRSIAEKAQRPVPILHIHGDADPVVPWDGMEGRFSVMEQMAFWAQKNGCNQRPFRDLYRHKDLSGPVFERYEYYSYPLDIDEFPKVFLIRAHNGNHDWFGSHTGYDIDANVEMWRFFQKFSL
ncbi:MAG: alpha/beta hydrolase family esterase, partial [Chloroflexota bacterium]